MSKEQEEFFFGPLLVEARKKKKLRYKKLSSELNIPESYLQALEEENYDVMPGGVPYIKGYLRAYAKKLDLDSDLIIEQYDLYLRKERKAIEKYSVKVEKTNSSRQNLFIATIVAFFISITILFFVSEDNSGDKISYSDNERLISEEVGGVVKNIIVETFDKEIKGKILISDKSREVKKVNLQTDHQISEEYLTVLVDTRNAINFIEEELDISGSLDLIEMTFLQDCWVEIRNFNETLVYKLAPAGSSLVLNENGPLKVIVGNAKLASLYFNGKNVDLLESSNRENNVSCVVLPSGKCSEFPR
jgi:cytoskeletal protein RodZ